MNSSATIDAQTALIHIMVLAAAVDGDMSDREMLIMGDLVDKLPAFNGFDRDKLGATAESCVGKLQDEDGLDALLDTIAASLPKRIAETGYAIACEVVACDNSAGQEELRFLEMLRHRLDVDRLTAAAIERGIAAINRAL